MIESILISLLGFSLVLGGLALMLLPVALVGFGIELLINKLRKRKYNEKSNG